MKIKNLVIVTSFIFMSGCGVAPSIYHWGNYSNSLYDYAKEPSEQTRIAHRSELLEIISHAETKKKLVPPGIYFELAVIEAENGDLETAHKYFSQEVALFPESTTVVKLALKELESK